MLWYGISALWSFSVWTLGTGIVYSAIVAKGSHAWQRWSSEGQVTCSCKYCLWSVEGARNPALAWQCEWEAAKEGVAYVATAGKTNCLTGEFYQRPKERTVAKMATAIWGKLKDD